MSDDSKETPKSGRGGARPGAGRPATVGADATLAIRVPSELRQRIDAVLREGESLSDLGRAALERECKRRE